MSVIKPGLEQFAPVAIGAALIVMVYSCGHVSGAHFNPAVTLAVWIRGKCETKDVPGYMGAQVAAAIVAGFVAPFLKGNQAIEAGTHAVFPALVAEFLITFALAWVVLNVATAKGTSGNSFYGLAIGFTVLSGAYAVGGVSGGVFNPAVAVGITVMGLASAADIWIYLVANLAGGAAAALAFKALADD